MTRIEQLVKTDHHIDEAVWAIEKSSTIAKTMKAAFVTEFGKPLTIGELPVPVPRNGEVLIKIEACGVCHTDVHAADGDWPVKPKLPFTPGHERFGGCGACFPSIVRIRLKIFGAGF